MRKFLLIFLIVGLSVSVSAQSLQNFEYSPSEDDYPVELTGGDSFNQLINFSSESDRGLPLGVRVTVENESTDFVTGDDLGAEFDVSGALIDSSSVRDLSFEERLTDGDLVYVGSLSDGVLRPQSENSLDLKIKAHNAVRPDSFDFEFDVRSVPGFASESETVEVSNGSADVEVDGNEVEVDVNGTEADATIESYSELTAPAPETDENFVGGVGVEVTDEEGKEVEASGTVSIGYDQEFVDNNGIEEASMDVYYYNDSSMQWTTEGVEVISRDSEENVVTAEVSHFSMYAAFAEEEEESSGGAGPIEWTPEDSNEEIQNNTEKDFENDTEAGSDPDMDTGEQDFSREDQNSTAPQEESVDETQQEASEAREDGVTGLFSGQPSNAVPATVILLIAVLIAYRYRERLRELY